MGTDSTGELNPVPSTSTAYALGDILLNSDIPLPGLTGPATPDVGTARPTLTIRRAPLMADESGWRLDRVWAEDGAPASLRHWRSTDMPPGGEKHRLRYAYREHRLEFVVAPADRLLTYAATEAVGDDDVAMLLGSGILGVALRLLGVPTLHATTLLVGSRAVAFCGPSGAGKSSLAAALAKAGFPVVADDMLIAARSASGWMVQPRLPALRLWRSTAERFGWEVSSDRRLWPGIPELEKFTVWPGTTPVQSPVPLGCICVLGPRGGTVAAFNELPPPRRVAVLAANVYGMVEPPALLRAGELTWAANLAATVPVFELRPPQGLDALHSVADAIRDHLDSVLAA